MAYEKPKRKAGYELADVGTRFIALLIDNIILGMITGLLFSSARWGGGAVGLLVGLAYYWYFWTRQDGQTLGNRLLNIRVIKTDGSPLSDSDAVLRYIGYYINSAVFAIGWFWAFFDSENQGWHDKIASTYVIRAD